MGYELAEQLDWELPDAILYPCGRRRRPDRNVEGLRGTGGTRLDRSKRPKMIAVQAAGCQPITRAFNQNEPGSQSWGSRNRRERAACAEAARRLSGAKSCARERAAQLISVSDEEMIDAGVLLAEDEGIFAAPEGGACVAAAQRLAESGFLQPEEQDRDLQHRFGTKVSGGVLDPVFADQTASEQDKLGGLITPR